MQDKHLWVTKKNLLLNIHLSIKNPNTWDRIKYVFNVVDANGVYLIVIGIKLSY